MASVRNPKKRKAFSEASPSTHAIPTLYRPCTKFPCLAALGFAVSIFPLSHPKESPMFELVITVLLATLTGYGATAARIIWAAALIIPS